MTTTTSLNLGPRAIAYSSVTNGKGFSLSSTEWIKIQVYVKEVLGLPTTLDDFKKTLGEGAPKDLSDFTKLITAYSDTHTHVNGWEKDTFPAIVSLASNVYNYALLVPTYYNPILPLAQKLIDNPEDKESKDKLTAILSVLSADAIKYKNNATSVADKIQTFAKLTENDQIVLSGSDGKGGYLKYYNDKYGSTSEESKSIIEDIKKQQKIIDDANAEYNYDVVVASTTPLYLVGTMWLDLFIPSIVAAVVVAGVYGDKATKALETVRAAEQQIKNLNEKEAADILLMTTLNTVDNSIYSLTSSLSKALPVIQTIEGAWKALADDLNAIIGTIKTNIQEALPIIMDLGVESAINEWTAVGKEADEYRHIAYITVEEEKK